MTVVFDFSAKIATPKARPMLRSHRTQRLRLQVQSLIALVLGCSGSSYVSAQSSSWDAAISNSNWYVPVPQLLAYASPRSGFNNPVPIGDQTLWAIGRAVNGSFSGLSTASLAIAGTTTTSQTVMQGTVSPTGQITILFTPTTGGTPTIGIGQMRARGDVPEMEMQMITGSGLLITHWAYMAPYNPATFSPPAAQAIPLDISARNWDWTQGTPWRIVSPTIFGTAGAGKSEWPGAFERDQPDTTGTRGRSIPGNLQHAACLPANGHGAARQHSRNGIG